MKRCFADVFVMVCILTTSGGVMATLSSSSEYHGEYPPANYEPEHGSIALEPSSNRGGIQTHARYWSHEPEDCHDHHFAVLSRIPLREKEEGTK